MKIYCDTNTLAGNLRDLSERVAMEQLKKLCDMVVSNIDHYEIMRVRFEPQRENLLIDYGGFDKVTKNEKLVGMHVQMDRRTTLNSPKFSNVQDESAFVTFEDASSHRSSRRESAAAVVASRHDQAWSLGRNGVKKEYTRKP